MTPVAHNNKHLFISWGLSIVTLITVGLATKVWTGAEDKLAAVQTEIEGVGIRVDRIRTSLDSLRENIAIREIRDSISMYDAIDDVSTVRKWLHRHPPETPHTFIFPEGQNR